MSLALTTTHENCYFQRRVSEGLWHPHEVCKRSLPSMTRACSLGQVDGVNDGVALGDTRGHSYRLAPLGIPQEFLC
jgi:hypothetical protein